MTKTADPEGTKGGHAKSHDAKNRLGHAAVRALAIDCGFDAVGITSPNATAEAGARLDAFLRQGFAGSMDWLAARRDERAAPRVLWPDVRSIIMLGQNYGPDTDPLTDLTRRRQGNISVYARNRDYHDVVKKRLKKMARLLIDQHGGTVKVFVDTAPVMEKPLAAAAGLGWQGKHTNLVSREFGSWLFLGAIFSTLEIEADQPETDHCGNCRACLDICPTNAFPAPYQLDARRCLSYLTIEHKGPIPRDYRRAMGNRIYGCDDCLAICPWNKFAQTASEAKLRARDDLTGPPLAELAMLDDAAFRAKFSGSPVKRTGRDRFIRNVMIAIGNAADASLSAVVCARLDDDSALVRGAAVWAASQLMTGSDFQREADRRIASESDPDVLREWHAVSETTAHE